MTGCALICLILVLGMTIAVVRGSGDYQKLKRQYELLDFRMNIYMRDRIFGRLLVPDPSSDKWMQSELDKYGISFPKTNVVVGVLTLADYPEEFLSAYASDGVDNNMYGIIRKYVEQVFQNDLILAQLTVRYEEFVLILNYTPEELGGDLYAVKNNLKMHTDALLHALEVQEGICLSYCMGREGMGLEGIARSFASANAAKEYRDMLGLDERRIEYHTSFEDIARFNTTMPVTGYRSLALQRQLTTCIEAHDYTEAKRVLEELIKNEFEEPPPIGTLKIKLYGILYVIYTAMSSTAIRSDENIYEVLPLQDEWFTSASVVEVGKFIGAAFDKLIQEGNADATQRDQPDWVAQAVEYLEQNFRDSSLNVNHVADHFGMNPQYLSKVFRKYVNCSIMDYLQTLRVEEAKRLLAQGFSVQDTAMRSGFSNTRTFSRIFTKYTGVTPGKYDRKSLPDG